MMSVLDGRDRGGGASPGRLALGYGGASSGGKGPFRAWAERPPARLWTCTGRPQSGGRRQRTSRHAGSRSVALRYLSRF
jgi:hypothetical protein